MNREQQIEYLKHELKRKLREAHEIQERIDALTHESYSNEDIKRLSE